MVTGNCLPVDLSEPRVAVDGEEPLGRAANPCRLPHVQQPYLVRVRVRVRVGVRVRARVRVRVRARGYGCSP